MSSEGVAIAIDYDQPGNIAAAGEVVSGRVTVQVSRKILLRGIRIYFYGAGKACWSNVGKLNCSREVYLSEAQELLQSRCNLYLALLLQPGVYSYPFSLRLPPDLPASYIDKSNYVRYKSKATVEGQCRGHKFTVEKAFLVSRQLDLNLEPGRLKRETRVRKEIYRSSDCCVSGTVNVDFSFNRRCFVAFENIILSGVIENLTDRTIRRTTISIVQEVTLLKSRLKRVLKTVVSKVDGPRVPPYQEENWSDVKLLVPLVPLSRSEGCNILKVGYSIRFSVAFRFPCSESSKTLKTIVIGNVPLQSSSTSTSSRDSLSRDGESRDSSSSTQMERRVQSPPSPSRTWGTQWDMINWMGPLRSSQGEGALSSPSSDSSDNESTSHQRTQGALKTTPTIPESPDRQRIHDSENLLADYM